MDMFKNGLPKDPSGNIDQPAMIEAYLKLKGGEAVPGMLQQLLRQRAIAANEREDAGQTSPRDSSPQYEGSGTSSRYPGSPSGEDTMSGSESTREPPANAPYGLNAQGRPAQATEGIISAVPTSGPNAGRNIAPQINAAGARTQPGADLVPPAMLARGVTPQQYADYAMRQARNYELAGFPEAGRTWQARAQGVLDSIKQAAELRPHRSEARSA